MSLEQKERMSTRNGDMFDENGNVKNIINTLETIGGGVVPFNLAVTQGKIDGYSKIDKFGLNPTITTTSDPEDVWEGGGTYTYDANGTAPIVSLASSSAAADNGIDIEITGLDINGEKVVQTITLGLTRQALTTPLWRVYRMANVGTTALTGTVFCYTGTGAAPTLGDSEIRAVITNGYNQTLMTLFTIEKGKVGFLMRGEAGMEWSGTGFFANPEAARVHYYSRRYGKVFRVKKSISLITAGTSVFQDERTFPDVIPALTDIKLTVEEVSDTMGIWGTFDILVVDEDQFSDEYLAAIGQPGY